jgi:SAM-dependent methyltransferase
MRLAPPPPAHPPPLLSPPRPAGTAATAVPIAGHTLADYSCFFALDLAGLRHLDVLDVGAGPASFVAEACTRKIHAVAVDPLYALGPDEIGSRVQPDGNEAALRFLADYAAHFAHRRYVAGSLPRLPFLDRTFDLVLCAGLLYTEATGGALEWHLAACDELVRVSAGEVRIYPVSGRSGKPYPRLATLRRELRSRGISTELRTVDAATPGTRASMLLLRRAGP